MAEFPIADKGKPQNMKIPKTYFRIL